MRSLEPADSIRKPIYRSIPAASVYGIIPPLPELLFLFQVILHQLAACLCRFVKVDQKIVVYTGTIKFSVRKVHRPERGHWQDICNATKHGVITRYTPKIVEARLHGGDFCPMDCYRDVDISRLGIRLHNGQTVWFIDAVGRALDYWSTFLEEHEIH